MTGLCQDRVCVITGAGNGLGRAYAKMLAAHGARVVVNDLGVSRDGSRETSSPAHDAVEEILAAGGSAVANVDDVSTFDGAESLVRQAIEEYGRLDVLINNAGILRDRTIVKMTESEFDDVVRVHLKSTFATTHFAAGHWRERSEVGEAVDGRVINTTSVSGLFGNYGQANYAAAKAGIASLTLVSAMELKRYGVTANAISPGALTRMTEGLRGEELSEEDKRVRAPEWVASYVTWLASTESGGITGRVILASGRRVAVAEGWIAGPTGTTTMDPMEAGESLAVMIEAARGNADMTGTPQ